VVFGLKVFIIDELSINLGVISGGKVNDISLSLSSGISIGTSVLNSGNIVKGVLVGKVVIVGVEAGKAGTDGVEGGKAGKAGMVGVEGGKAGKAGTVGVEGGFVGTTVSNGQFLISFPIVCNL
jgi:hypothetical protein